MGNACSYILTSDDASLQIYFGWRFVSIPGTHPLCAPCWLLPQEAAPRHARLHHQAPGLPVHLTGSRRMWQPSALVLLHRAQVHWPIPAHAPAVLTADMSGQNNGLDKHQGFIVLHCGRPMWLAAQKSDYMGGAHTRSCVSAARALSRASSSYSSSSLGMPCSKAARCEHTVSWKC